MDKNKFRKGIQEKGGSFKEFGIWSGTGYHLLNGKEFGKIQVNFGSFDFNRFVLVEGVADIAKKYNQGHMVQLLVVDCSPTGIPQIYSSCYDKNINNPISEYNVNQAFKKKYAHECLLMLNVGIAETQLKNKQGPAYEVLQYLKYNKNISQSEDKALKVLRKVLVTRDLWRAALNALLALGYVYSDGQIASWTGKEYDFK